MMWSILLDHIKEINKLAQKLDIIIAIVDTRVPQAGFVCHYIAENEECIVNIEGNIPLPNKPIVKIAATGNHFLSVRQHPSLSVGGYQGQPEVVTIDTEASLSYTSNYNNEEPTKIHPSLTDDLKKLQEELGVKEEKLNCAIIKELEEDFLDPFSENESNSGIEERNLVLIQEQNFSKSAYYLILEKHGLFKIKQKVFELEDIGNTCNLPSKFKIKRRNSFIY